MDVNNIIYRLGVIKKYAMLSKSDNDTIEDAIAYIENNERRMDIPRPNPLFPTYDINNSEPD